MLKLKRNRQCVQLSDVTKDGCLSLEEFLTAMHLVVLRRNDIPLPEQVTPPTPTALTQPPSCLYVSDPSV